MTAPFVPLCPMCNDTGYKDYAGFSMDRCDHGVEQQDRDWWANWMARSYGPDYEDVALIRSGRLGDCAAVRMIARHRLALQPARSRIRNYFQLAPQIVNSKPVIGTFAACEWDELDDNGKVWIAKIVQSACEYADAADEKLREAAQAVIDMRASTFKARNGRSVGIQGDDGEKVWLVHSDYMFTLEQALLIPAPNFQTCPTCGGQFDAAEYQDGSVCPECETPKPAAQETPDFEREERFIVIKRKHLSRAKEEALRQHLHDDGIDTVDCVVVESDWPEYETVWHMIAARARQAAQ